MLVCPNSSKHAGKKGTSASARLHSVKMLRMEAGTIDVETRYLTNCHVPMTLAWHRIAGFLECVLRYENET